MGVAVVLRITIVPNRKTGHKPDHQHEGTATFIGSVFLNNRGFNYVIAVSEYCKLARRIVCTHRMSKIVVKTIPTCQLPNVNDTLLMCKRLTH